MGDRLDPLVAEVRCQTAGVDRVGLGSTGCSAWPVAGPRPNRPQGTLRKGSCRIPCGLAGEVGPQGTHEGGQEIARLLLEAHDLQGLDDVAAGMAEDITYEKNLNRVVHIAPAVE